MNGVSAKYIKFVANPFNYEQTFAERFSISNAFAYSYLSQYKGLELIYDYYDIEHTFSIDDAVEDMQKICRRNGGPLV